jgi:hypothetical protein
MKMIVESMMECRLAGETEVLGENLPQRHHKIPRAHPGLNLGRRDGKPATNRLSYGAARYLTLIFIRSFIYASTDLCWPMMAFSVS